LLLLFSISTPFFNIKDLAYQFNQTKLQNYFLEIYCIIVLLILALANIGIKNYE